MLKDLQNIFRQTWSSFLTEVGRREPEDEVAELLGMMRREMVAARAALPGMDEAVAAVAAELERERRALGDCERRASLAERIGDTETVRVAHEFAERHREHIAVLEKRHEAVSAERELARREVQQMSARYKEADSNRFVLLSELRRRRAAGRIEEAVHGGAFGDFARMEEAVDESAAYADALEDLEEVGPEPAGPSPEERIRNLEDRLDELKRRMGKG